MNLHSRLWTIGVFWFAIAVNTASGEQVVVGLDRWYNAETRDGRPYHYAWEDTKPSGYSEFGKLLESLGAKLASINEPASRKSLAGVDIYIIVDPDTPKEVSRPNWIDGKAIEAVVEWVEDGGVLLLLNNNEGETEFEHINQLAGRFGIRFNEDTRFGLDADPKQLQMHTFPDHPFFKGVEKLHMRSICTLKVEPPAEVVYRFRGDNIMALSRRGKGLVFAVGDPWGYNEYIDFFDNRRCLENIFRRLIEEAKSSHS
jgi:unsaturated rhamnogalacturonyl hydrolase